MDNNEFQRLILEKLSSMEARQNEIYELVKAIDHSNQVGRAELDKQDFRISKVEGKLKATAKIFDEDAMEAVSNL